MMGNFLELMRAWGGRGATDPQQIYSAKTIYGKTGGDQKTDQVLNACD